MLDLHNGGHCVTRGADGGEGATGGFVVNGTVVVIRCSDGASLAQQEADPLPAEVGKSCRNTLVVRGPVKLCLEFRSDGWIDGGFQTRGGGTQRSTATTYHVGDPESVALD